MKRIEFILTHKLMTIFLVSVVAMFLFQAPLAAKTITLRCGWTFPQHHPYGIAHEAFAEKIEKESNGQVKFEHYWGGSLINMRSSYNELKEGVADLTEFSGNHVREGFHIEKSMGLVFCKVRPNSETMYRIYNELRKKYPEIDQEHSEIKVLTYIAPSSLQIFTVKKPIKTIDDMKGLSFKTTGLDSRVVKNLGAEGASIPPPETYTSLQKNIIDGAFLSWEAMKTYSLAEVIKYATVTDIGAWPTSHVGMNLESYNKLPKDIQELFDDNIDYYSRTAASTWLDADNAGMRFSRRQGVQFLDLSESDMAKYYEAADKVLDEEIKRLDDMGLPGSAMRKDAKALIEKYLHY
ncbi:MAG: TRAP transporter substrate-binding protein DctP [Deltaproteobacteria bacterium]|nr:TRAP transporter substrate-binding protein DctP [Deltaproteobacteria bacterium]